MEQKMIEAYNKIKECSVDSALPIEQIMFRWFSAGWKANASRKQLTTASMQARKASTKTLRSCHNCGKVYSLDCNKCLLTDYKYWQPRKASA